MKYRKKLIRVIIIAAVVIIVISEIVSYHNMTEIIEEPDGPTAVAFG